MILKLLIIFTFNVFSSSIQTNVRLGDRFLVGNYLLQLFGKESLPIIEEGIFSRPEAFGGACSLMEEIWKEDDGQAKNVSSQYYCRSGIWESKLPPFSFNTFTRHSLVVNTCSRLVRFTKGTSQLIDELGLVAQHTFKIENLINKFYPYFKAQDFAYALEAVVRKDLAELDNKLSIGIDFKNSSLTILNEELRLALYLLCISEEWQKI